jgi:polyketide cyclase/dehydrase/lipid transport protein
MIRVRLTSVVNRPLEVVFAALADFMNLPEYEPSVEKVVMEPLLRTQVRRQGEEVHRRFKEILERAGTS